MDAKSPKDLHFYEPKNGHGLKHDPFNAIIAPRPIGWISSMGAKGNLNLAPYSFFNIFNYKPPILAFSSNGWKDTVRNIEETKEFVWNLSTMSLAPGLAALLFVRLSQRERAERLAKGRFRDPPAGQASSPHAVER